MRIVHPLLAVLVAVAGLTACQREPKKSSGGQAAVPIVDSVDIDSKDILARTELAESSDVKHILLGWKDLSEVYGPRMDKRAKEREQAAASKLAQELANKLRAKPDSIDALVKEHSEDPGSLRGTPYTVNAAARFVPEFKDLAMRLKLNEVGIVKTQFGYHVMIRVAPGAEKPPVADKSTPPAPTGPDPLESNDILARPAPTKAEPAFIQHVMISFKTRSKEDADKLAKDVFAKAKANGDMPALMKEFSEDPASKDSGRVYEIPPTGEDPLIKLAARLTIGEVGMIKSPAAWHVVKRVTPPPPDPLESHDILARPAPASPAVAHMQPILIGWDGSNPDPRAKRTKAEADKVAQEVLAKVRAKGDMAKLMKQFSEEPGSKDSGKVYDMPPSDDPIGRLVQRLAVGEAGMVKSPSNAWLIIKRVPAPPPPPPPAPDKLDSKDILKRAPVAQKTKVKHILLGWAEVNSGEPRGAARSRADLEKLVKATMERLKKGEKIEPLMKELSEDGGSAQAGTDYEVTPDAGLVQPFKDLGLRLNVGEVGAVKTQFGIHIIQRIE